MISNGDHDGAPAARVGDARSRERRVAATFLAVTDTLVGDFDAVDMLTTLAERCVELLDVSAAGVMLDDGAGRLSLAAASTEQARVLGVYVAGGEDGPCSDCLRVGTAIAVDDLGHPTRQRWPRFSRTARDVGFGAALVLPMRLRGDAIGVLALLRVESQPHTERDTRLGQALADAATSGLLHERTVRHVEDTVEQLRGALASRIVIEQAKGVLASRAGTTPEAAFTAMRDRSRRHGRRLTVIAREVVDRTVDWDALG